MDAFASLSLSSVNVEPPHDVPGLATFLRTYAHNSNAITAACKILQELLGNGEENAQARKTFHEKNGVTNLIAALRSNASDDAFVREGCFALHWAVWHDADLIKVAAQANIVNVLVDLFERHSSNAEAIEAICDATSAVCFRSEQNARGFGQAGGMLLIVDAFRMHADKEKVVEKASGCVMNLCISEHNKRSFADNGGVPLLVDALRTHMQNATVCERACGAAQNACSGEEHKRFFIDAGGVQALVEILKAHKANLRVVGAVSWALWNFSSREESRRIVDENGGVDALLSIMKAQSSNVQLMRPLTGALGTLSATDSILKKIVDFGAVPVYVEILSRSIGNAHMVEQLVAAIANMEHRDESVRNAVIEANGVTVLVSVLRQHIESPVAMKWACGSLCEIIQTPETFRVFKSLGAEEIVDRAAARHPAVRQIGALKQAIEKMNAPPPAEAPAADAAASSE